MKVIDVEQGSQAWLDLRASHYCASDAAAMMGLSPYKTRTQLLDQLSTGVVEEILPHQQAIFDKGHQVEALARPIIEQLIGEELYPVVGTAKVAGMNLLASLDGLTMGDDLIFEHKLWNEKLAEAVESGEIPDTHWPQLEHQLLVTGADRVIFVVSNGTAEKMTYTYYESVPDRRDQLISAWKQFDADLKTHVVADKVADVVADSVMALPALSINVGGAISVQSNLDRFGERLKAFISETNAKPETDQDFVNLEQACKVLKEAEDALKSAQASALAQTSSIDELCRTVDYLAETARTSRLQFEKLVKSEKENRKTAIVSSARALFLEYVANLQITCPVQLNTQVPNFAEAIKGKKLLSAMQNAVDTMLANAKIDVNKLAIDLHEKHVWYKKSYGAGNGVNGFDFLFPDLQQLIYKQIDDFKLAVDSRVIQHKESERVKAEQAEKARIEREAKIAQEAAEHAAREERERIEAEARVKAEAETKVIREQQTKEREESERIEEEARKTIEIEKQKKQAAIDEYEKNRVSAESTQGLSYDQAIVLINNLVSGGLLNTQLFLGAIAKINSDDKQSGGDGLDGYRIHTSLCCTVCDITKMLNDMPTEAKAMLKPVIKVRQDFIKHDRALHH